MIDHDQLTYAKLDEKEEAEMQSIIDTEPEYADVKEADLTYYGRVEFKIRQDEAVKWLMDLCEVLGIPLTQERRDELAQMDLYRLWTLRDHIKHHRQWPSK